METKIVSSKELGTNCWSTARFSEGKRCPRVMQCNYPEKRTCKAVDAEIAYLDAKLTATQQRIEKQIDRLVWDK